MKIRETGTPTQQAIESGAPWTDTLVYRSYYLVLKLGKLGFQPSKQGRQELPSLRRRTPNCICPNSGVNYRTNEIYP